MEVEDPDEGVAARSDAPLIFYKNSLLILRARRLNFEAIEKQGGFESNSGAETTYEDVVNMVDALNKFISYTTLVKRALQSIINNEEMLKKPETFEIILQGVTLMCQRIRKLKIPSCQILYRERLEYSKVLGLYWQSLIGKRDDVQNKRTKQSTTLAKLEKAESDLQKLNLIRVMKRVFIGSFFSDSLKHPQISSFQTSMRRDLTVHDFKDSWDLGFEDDNYQE